MCRASFTIIALLLPVLCFAPGCARRPDANTLVMIIESSPANLDPRIGTDAQSEHIGKLIFDSLVHRREDFTLEPHLAERWETPDPVTYIFHLRRGVTFHDGRPLTARDVKWTFDTIMNSGVEGGVITAKASTFRFVDKIEAPDEYTVVFRLKEPYATMLWNVSDGATGIVPYGSDRNFFRKPVGSGPYKFVSMSQDNDVVIERNEGYWGDKARIERIRFAVVPDTTTRALELRKGSADVMINALPADMVHTLKKESSLEIQTAPGTIYAYLTFNLRDEYLKDVRVRQALAYAINRQPMIHYLWRDLVEPANSVLPQQHWAYDPDLPRYEYDPQKANALLDQAGHKRGADGIRFRITMKTSTEETTRLLAAVLQQQLRGVGIALDIRSFEFGTFYADVLRGAFQVYSLRWIGGNQDPDIFEHVFHSASIPPKRANRGFYSNPAVDELIDEARRISDQAKRKEIYFRIQQILSRDLPYIHLWYMDNVVVHSKRLRNVSISPSGNYDFLKTAELVH